MSYRKTLIKLVTFLGGIYYFLEFVMPKEFTIAGEVYQFNRYHEQIVIGFIVFGAMAVGLGIINLLLFHGSRLAFRRSGWVNSFALLLGLGFMMFITIQEWMVSRQVANEAQAFFNLRDFATKVFSEAEIPPEREQLVYTSIANQLTQISSLPALAPAQVKEWTGSPVEELAVNASYQALTQALDTLGELKNQGSSGELDSTRRSELIAATGAVGVALREHLTAFNVSSNTLRFYRFFFDGVFTALGTAMFALLGFYIATAAYRAFRIRTAESALMMAAALIVMLGQIPFGIWIWEEFPAIRLWLLETPSTAARRAIEIGAAIAGLVMAFRMWLSIESESFARRQ